MGKAEQRAKDAAMAARLKDHPYHNAKAVKVRKEARFKSFMSKLQSK